MPEQTPTLFDIIPEGVFIAALTVLGGLLGALITAWVTSGKGKSDAAQGLIDRLEKRVDASDRRSDGLEARVSTLETERDQMRIERDHALRRADDADDTLRDRDQLIDALTAWSKELLTWGHAGGPPPPPVPSWQIPAYLADLAANAETLRLEQQKEDS